MSRRARPWLVVAGLLALAAVTPPAARAQERRSVSTASGEVTILADRMEDLGPRRTLVATGNVEITRGTTRIVADRVEIDRDTEDAVAEGRVIIYDGEDRVAGERVEYNLRRGTGVVHHGEARAAPFYRLSGERMERLDERRYDVRHGVLTTCEDDPPAWSFHFGEAHATLDEYVWGRDASVWVKGLPLLPWLPVFAAPLRQERQSGFLVPRFGSSSTKGFSWEQPFYWAISDSQDATISLDVLTRRGIGATGEYRYVLAEDHRGVARGRYLNEVFGGDGASGHDEHRGWWALEHEWDVGRPLSFHADVKGVSDDFVFREYGDQLQERSRQRVESNVFVTRTWPAWSLVGNLFWYQDLASRRPTELHRLPEIRLQGPSQPVPGLPGVLYSLESSAVAFFRDVGSGGLRADLHPILSRPVALPGLLTFTPFVGGRLTAYDKTAVGSKVNSGILVDVIENDPRVRRLVEAGAMVETNLSRAYAVGGTAGIDALLHTIEPRVALGWIEGSNVKNLPSYETAVEAIRPATLVAYSLTNRLRARSASGPGGEPRRWEALRLVLAQTMDVRDEDKPFRQLTGDLILDSGRQVSFRGTAGYDVHAGALQSGSTDLAVALDRVTASIGTQYERNQVHYVAGTLRADLGPHLLARTTSSWDVRRGEYVEQRVALDLKFQCWALGVEFVARNAGDNEVRVALNLLGVGQALQTQTRAR